MDDSELSVGIIGAGTIATMMHLPVLRAMPQYRIAWIADIDTRAAKRVAAANGLKSIDIIGNIDNLPETDVALFAIPLVPRADYFKHFSTKSTAIFAEKPLANTATEHQAIMETFDPWSVSVGYQRRFYATSRLVAKFLREGVFGTLHRIRVREGGRLTKTGGGVYKDASIEDGGGIVKNLGCHSLDLALWLTQAFDYEIAERTVEWDGETDRACWARIVLHHRLVAGDDQCLLEWTVSWLENQPNTFELEFETMKLELPVGPASSISLLERNGHRLADVSATETGYAVTSAQAFYLEWRDLYDAIRTRTPPELSAQSSLLMARLMDDLLEIGKAR